MKRSKKPWECSPKEKLWEIAMKADPVTKTHIKTWMDTYIKDSSPKLNLEELSILEEPKGG